MPFIIHYLDSTAGRVAVSRVLPACSQQAVELVLNLRLDTNNILHTVGIVGTANI